MRELLDRLANPAHLLVALACTWLIVSSPWIGMYQLMPDEPGAINLSHVVLGLSLLPLGIVYLVACTLGGRWRLYFPWIAGEWSGLGGDVAGLFRGQRPGGSEGAGLFATIEGLLLLALLATAVTGTLWFSTQGAQTAVFWRDHHIVAARFFAVLMLLHVVAVALHFVDFVRD